MFAWSTVGAACLSLEVSGQTSPAVGGDAANLTRIQLVDTSFIQRAVAMERLRTSATPIRQEAVRLFANAVGDRTPVARNRAMAGLVVLREDAASAVGPIVAIARDAQSDQRGLAINTLGALGPIAQAALPALREISREPNANLRLQAASAMVQVGDTSAALAAFSMVMRSGNGRQVWVAATELATLGDTTAVPVLVRSLSDSSFAIRSGAAAALGKMGPRARAAIPALATMLGDTMPRSVAQGQVSETEVGAAFAAWALSQIIVFRSVASNTVLDPLQAWVEGGNALKGDGLGVYAWGVDSVAAWLGSGLFLHLSPPTPARGPLGPSRPGFRRSLSFDLSQPVPGSGAVTRGVVRDNEAYLWIWYRRDPATDRVTTLREISVSDSVHNLERIEMHFRINGVLHVLQMGPFVEGQGGAGPWFTGIHGDGTTLGSLTHPHPDLWRVTAPSGSVARLWSFEDRTRPLNRGLYRFSLNVKFAKLPGGANGVCVPTLRCSWLRP